MSKLQIVLLCSCVLFLLGGVASAGVPELISYQGQLNDAGGTPVNGSVGFVFTLYDMAEGGTELWSENQTISVSNGVFNVDLGEVTPLPSTVFQEGVVYLGIRAGADQEMTPRQRVVSGAFTQVAEHVNQIEKFSVVPKNAGRDRSVVSFWVNLNTTIREVELTVVPSDKILIITDFKAYTGSDRTAPLLAYNIGSGYVTVYSSLSWQARAGVGTQLDETFRAGIPIPAGASLKLTERTINGVEYTVAGFLIPAD